MQQYSNDVFTSLGGNIVPLASASCYVYLYGTTTLATIYSDNGVTTTTNPLTTTATGHIAFYATDGHYAVSIQKTGYTTVSIPDVLLEDPTVASAGTFTTINASGLVTIGSGTPLGGATNPIISSTVGANNYVQDYVYNTTNGVSSSADYVCYVSNSSDTHGWADIGMTSLAYADAVYTVTGPNEAYLFGSGPTATTGTGNLVIATDSTGTANSIQFYTGGFTQAKAAARFTISGAGKVTIAPGTATPAGGTAGLGLTLGSTTNLGVFFGSGVPTLSAAQGSLYMRTDGSSTSTRLYVNTTGSTVWTNVTTAT